MSGFPFRVLVILLLTALSFVAFACDDDDDDNDSVDDNTSDDDSADDDDTDDDDNDDSGDDDDDSVHDVWEDPLTGLMWQNDSDCCYEWDEAKTHCDDLVWSDYSDWRLPSISELRSLIRGCEDSESDGSCGVDDSCLDSSCWSGSCGGCIYDDGPADGCYWPSTLNGICGMYWSSSEISDYLTPYAWFVDFHYGDISGSGDGYDQDVRCVRN